jgi:uncharacterized protein (DUF302 family)
MGVDLVRRRIKARLHGREIMTYHFTKRLRLPFEAAMQRVTEALKQGGFGILTEIDVQQTLKKKLDVDFRPYRILGACNPSLAYQALQAEDKIGTMLPCNVVVQDVGGGMVEVSGVDPVASMAAIDNPKLADVAKTVQANLRAVIDTL